MTVIERFNQKFTINPVTKCWVWHGAIGSHGYGMFKGRTLTTAHRVSYEFFIETIPEGLYVLHSCDNRRCVNPEHLSVGTASRNNFEAYARNRRCAPGLRGLKHPMVKLNEEQVLAIRDDKRSCSAIALSYSIGRSQVSRIRTGKNWKLL